MSMTLRHNLIGLTIAFVAIAGGAVWLNVRNQKEQQKPQPKAPVSNESSPKEQPNTESFNKKLYSTTDPTSIWVVVNKKHPLNPKTHVPSELSTPSVKLRLGSGEEQMKFRKLAQADLAGMFNAARADGVNLVFGSGYRSYALQKQFYDGYVAKDGQDKADTYSARPGYSEHQTGLAVDLTSPSGQCHLEICWENTLEGKWIAANAYKYGFIMRYPPDTQDVTGYQYEPWHLRYVGKELSSEMHDQKVQTLEEFFEINGGTSY